MNKAVASALAVVVGTSLVGVATPARAASGWDRCPSGYFCAFDGFDGTGAMAYFRTGSPDLRQQGMDNRASSVWNRSPRTFGVYDGYNYTGTKFFSLVGNSGQFNFRDLYYNNAISSLRAE